ncbi:MAG TPA: CopD family protein [Candidatus Binatia bacterium]
MLALEASASATSYMALALLVGQLAVAGFLLPRNELSVLRRSLLTAAKVSLLVFLCVALLALVVQGAKLQHGFPTTELLWRYLTLALSGKVWIAREAYGMAMLIGIIWALGKNEVSTNLARWFALLALPLVASSSLTSHAVAVRDDTTIAVIADVIHLLATALWAGGLVALSQIFYLNNRQNQLSPALIAETVNRFSRLALISVALLFFTGVYQSWIHVGSLSILKNTEYGNVLMSKVAIFACMVAFGAFKLVSTKPRLNKLANTTGHVRAISQRALIRIGAESLLGLLIFSITGLLTALPPGIHAVHQTTATATLQSLSPPEGARVKIISPAPYQIFRGDKVPLKFDLTKGKRGDHVHAYVDGELMGMFESKQGTLNGLAPGRHTLELRVVAEDHQTELDARDRTEFIVK